jgi:hypothetical protein
VPVSENIQPNTEITGSISITATGTATSASFLANRLVIETAAGTSSQPTLTFTSISLVKTTSVVTASGSTLSAQLNWLKNNAASNSSYILTANASETIAPQNLSWNGKNNIMVFLQGDYTDRTISLSTQGAMFTVGSGLTLILDNNITLKGRSDNTASVLVVESGGKLIMNTGTNITGNTPNDSNHGGGVLNSGEFTMNGGTISGNSATHYGGGGVRNFGEFTMNGGTISGNSAGYGGGVRFDSGEFTMNGGTISGNSASGGGGVSVVYRTFTMNGGTISGNIANDDGGGINLLFGTFRMSGGTIYGSSASSTLRNTAGSSGAALYKSSSTAEYGVYSGETFYPSGILNTSEDTIRVQNGNLYNN